MNSMLTFLILFLSLIIQTSFAESPGSQSAAVTQSPPVFTSSAPIDPHSAGDQFIYNFSVTDADSDPISFFTAGVDQQDANFISEVYWSTGYRSYLWQSFTAVSTGLMTRGALLTAQQFTTDVIVNVYSGEGTGGQLIYTTTINFNGGIYDYHAFNIPASANVVLTTGQVYTIEYLSSLTGYMPGPDIYSRYGGGRADFGSDWDNPFYVNIQPFITTPAATWLSLTDNANGTGSLSGTPSVENVGSFSTILVAKAGSDYVQQQISFNITNPVSDPTGLFAIAGDGQIELKWNKNAPANFGKYYIYGGTSLNPTTLIDSSLSVSDTTKIITGLTNGTLYYFRLKAKSSSNVLSGFSNEDAAVPVANEGNSLLLDGYSQYVVLPSNSYYQNHNFTMEVWAKRNSTYSGDWIFGQGVTGQDIGLHIGFRESNGFSFALYADDLEQGQPNSSTSWQHLALTYDAGTQSQKMYIDGVLVNSRVSFGVYNGYGDFYIGRSAWSLSDAFDGSLDEVRLWNYVRSDSEINDNRILALRGDEPGLLGLYHFDEPSGTVVYDASPNGINGTIVGGASFVESDAFISTTLPVELSSFTGRISGRDIVLNWSTASEENNAGWEIQRQKLEDRSEKVEWETIGFVAGKGTTTESQNYVFSSPVTRNPSPVTLRLKQLDLDGTVSFSQILTIENKAAEFALQQNYPNPFNPSTKIDFSLPVSGYAKLVVFDLLGREVKTLIDQNLEAGFHTAVYDAGNVAAGVYFYQLTFNGKVETRKFTLLK
ncbi:MAG: T9SS type A sorting domain-containing protein [Bacteroidetes bacterium]|nr:T9SS type A sorting domain-containing protein [Bacteroidota bacterium]